ncbi:MAG: HD domain-containing phosphohydrolase [Candidatus Omnitrophota bacterium]
MAKRKKQKEALETLLEVSKKVSSSLDLEKVSGMILKQMKLVFNTDFSALFLLSDDYKHLMLAGANGFRSNQIENLKILAGWEKINTEIVKKSKVISVNDVSKSATFKNEKISLSKEGFPLGAFLAVPLKKDSKIIGVLAVSNHKKRKKCFTEADKKLLLTLANHVSIALSNAKLYKNMKGLFLDTVTSLVTAVDAKDPYTHGHSERVSRYAVAIGKEMSLSPDLLEELRLAGLMHDVGKIGISDAILSKKGKLNKIEREKIKKHPAIGSKIVESIMHSKGIMRGIVEHHEFFNGKGYPKSLKRKEISLEGRIIAIADAFDTLTTDRPYQKAFSPKESALEIIRSSGTQFDPEVVRAFQKSLSKNPAEWKFS